MLKTFHLLSFLVLLFTLGSSDCFAQNTVQKSGKAHMEKEECCKILLEGSYSKIERPFVFVARDDAAYANLRKMVSDLPEEPGIDFSNEAIIAGFAGEKSTGGFRVKIEKASGEYKIMVSKPEKGSMVSQVITNPFQIVKASIPNNDAVRINLSDDFSNALQKFDVTKSSFGFSGGIAGIRKSFNANGTIGVMKYGGFITLIFDLKETGTETPRRLCDTATGTIKEKTILLSKVDAGAFVDNPHPEFSALGMLREYDLSLNFIPLPDFIADGYRGQGTLTAEIMKKNVRLP